MKNIKTLSAIKILIKLWNYKGVVKTYHTAKSKRFYAILKVEKFQKAYLKVRYGNKKNDQSYIEEFYNDGDYDTKTELLHAFKAFSEIDEANTGNVPVKN